MYMSLTAEEHRARQRAFTFITEIWTNLFV